MMLQTLLRSALCLPLFLSVPAFAAGPAALPASSFEQATMTQAVGLPGVFAPAVPRTPLVLAQAADPRIAQLEEQVRQLNGLVEELTFQILQMQDQIRRIQEDNEYRFQQLEERRSDSGRGERPHSDAASSPPPDASDDFAALRDEDGSLDLGTPAREFGTIVFDADGNVRSSTIGEGVVVAPPQTDGTTVAALPPADTAEELYRNSYEFVLSGDYATAEAGFRDFIDRFPGTALEADAHFWLGEALLAQQRPREAAEIFLAASRSFPQATKAPEVLYKLGVSLVALNQREVACATFAEVGNRYPNASAALRERVREERASASC